MRDHFGVAAAAEAVAVGLELAAQLDVVVDLAVLRTPHVGAVAGEWLVPAFYVDDAQPTCAECDTGRDVVAAVVRPPVPDHFSHSLERLSIDDLPRRAADLRDTTNPTH